MKKVFCQVFKKQKKPAFMLTVAISKRNKLQNIIVLTPKDGKWIEKDMDTIVANTANMANMASIMAQADFPLYFFEKND